MEQPQNQERLRVELQRNFLLQKVSHQAVFSGTAVCIAALLHIWVSVSSLGIWGIAFPRSRLECSQLLEADEVLPFQVEARLPAQNNCGLFEGLWMIDELHL